MLTGRLVRDLATTTLLATLLGLYVRTFLAQPLRVPSASMEPTLLVGDYLLADRSTFSWGLGSTWRFPLVPAREPRRGDVLVFRHPQRPETLLVKRCVALPGELVQLVNGRLWIDGRPTDETYLPSSPWSGDLPLHVDLGPDQYFMLGDHRAQSSDSRHWGPLPRQAIQGRALLIYWSTGPPPTPSGEDTGWSRIATILKQRLSVTRWGRIARPVH
jgi:signal peptidase I